jgi:transposase
VDDYVAADNVARAIDAYVDSCGLAALGFGRMAPTLHDAGQPVFSPADMLKLYLYGYLHRVRSSRRLERET